MDCVGPCRPLDGLSLPFYCPLSDIRRDLAALSDGLVGKSGGKQGGQLGKNATTKASGHDGEDQCGGRESEKWWRLGGGFFFSATSWHAGPNPCPLQWKHGVLTTGPPGNSPGCVFKVVSTSWL